jgi:hypothetical protein
MVKHYKLQQKVVDLPSPVLACHADCMVVREVGPFVVGQYSRGGD